MTENKEFIQDMINKQRSWDENIGRLIVFAITIIIAVWVLGLLGYFYTEYQEEARVMSVMSSSSSTLSDLQGIDVCGSGATAGGIDFDAVANEYAVGCEGDGGSKEFEGNFDDFAEDYGQINYLDDASFTGDITGVDEDNNLEYYEIDQ